MNVLHCNLETVEATGPAACSLVANRSVRFLLTVPSEADVSTQEMKSIQEGVFFFLGS